MTDDAPPVRLHLPLPSHRLTKNETGRAQSRAAARANWAVARDHREWAEVAATAYLQGRGLTPGEDMLFPAAVPLRVTCYVERAAGGNVWDDSGLIEALKPYMDGFEGLLYPDDKALRWGAITWGPRTRPKGAAEITIMFRREPARERVFRASGAEVDFLAATLRQAAAALAEAAAAAPPAARERHRHATAGLAQILGTLEAQCAEGRAEGDEAHPDPMGYEAERRELVREGWLDPDPTAADRKRHE